MMNNGATIRIGVSQPLIAQGIRPEESDLDRIVSSARANVEHPAELIARAGRSDVDVICLPEDVCGLAGMLTYGQDEALVHAAVHKVADESIALLADAARSARVAVVGAACLPMEERLFNTAFLIGRDGNMNGTYRKTHLPPGEEHRMVEGQEMPVFDTDFGRVGMIICWDIMFPETTRVLALKGAQVVFCPTLGLDFGGEAMGEMRMRVRAFDNALYLATSMYAQPKGNAPGRSCIAGPQGHLMADAGYTPDAIVFADINPADRGPDQADPDGKDGLDMWQRWARSRRPGVYGALGTT